MTQRRFYLLTLLTLAGLILGGCGNRPPLTPPAGLETARPPATQAAPTLAPLADYAIPPYYSANYESLITTSRREMELVIYSEFASQRWQPLIAAFNQRYPWIEVRFSAWEAANFSEQYRNDLEQGLPTADMILSTDATTWYEAGVRGEIHPYQSEESAYLPIWATQYAGMYPVYLDPAVIVYYRNLVTTPPVNMIALGNIIRRSPEQYRLRVAAVNPNLNTEALLVNWYWNQAKGESGWELLEKINQAETRLYPSKEALMGELVRDQVRIGYFIPASTVLEAARKYPNLDFSYLKDGQPIFIGYMGITNRAAHPASARLLLDFLLSQDGQVLLGQNGLMPYRSDIVGAVDYHLTTLENELGAERLIFMQIYGDLYVTKNRTEFLGQWNRVFNWQPASE